MIKEVKLPEVSDNVEMGDVLKVLVKIGDKIEIDQPLVELETEKATFEVPSNESGVVKEIKVKEGDTIKIGAVILTLESNGDGEKKEEKSDDKKEEKDDKNNENNEKKSADEKVEKKVEDKDEKASEKKAVETDEEGVEKSDEEKVEKSHDKKEKKDGEKKEEKSDDKEEEKKNERKDDKGDEKKGEKDDDREEEKKDEKKDEKKEEKDDEKKDIYVSKTPAPASPSVRRLARELGVEINSVTVSGENGRITEDDIKNYVKARLNSDSSSGISAVQKSLPDFKKWGEIEIESMSKIRSITAETMAYAWTTIPMVTQFDKSDMTQIEEFRKKNLKKVEDAGGHLTITSILVKVCEAALRSFPQFNSSIDLQKKEIVYKKYFNIGVAVDTDRGLLVPVIKNIDKKNITEISRELNELAEKARSKKITPVEMDGGNFTISNLGGIGGTAFSPIVYPPQVAILGVSRGSNEAVYVNDKFEPRLMLPLALTYDHRIIDGADAARFLRRICEALENPISMMI